jgi:hypothetical protein
MSEKPVKVALATILLVREVVAMDAAWGLGTLAWQTIRLAIGLALVSAVLNVLVRPAHLAARPEGG